MSIRKTAGVTLLVCLCALVSSAQDQKTQIPLREPDYNKPKLFDQLPSKVAVQVEDLQKLLQMPTDTKTARLQIQGGKTNTLSGEITSSANKYNGNLRSIVFRSNEFHGATVTVSAIKDDRGTVSYTGRIISMEHGDLLELRQEKGQYYFVKRGFYDLVNE